jgi:hypothetical protein
MTTFALLIIGTGVYSVVAPVTTVSTYRTEAECKVAGVSYVELASKAYPHDRFRFLCVAGGEDR